MALQSQHKIATGSNVSSLWNRIKMYVTNIIKPLATVKTSVVTVPSSGWVQQSDGSYRQSVTVSSMVVTDSPIIDVSLSSDKNAAQLQIEAYGLLNRGEAANNSLTLYCFDEKPTIDFNIQVMVVKQHG